MTLIGQRLSALGLSPRLGSVVEAGRRLLAMQGQDLAAVKWALASRCAGATERDVEHAFNRRDLVRSWPLRGTLHVVPAEDLEWMRALLCERNLARHVKRHRDLGLTDEVFRDARGIAERELELSPLTRDALLRLFEQGGVSTEGQRGVHLLWKLAQWGVLCLGDFEGKEQRFVLSAKWIASSRQLTGDEALGELAIRYLRGHGPSAMEDLAWWAGLTKTEAKRALAIAGPSEVESSLDRYNEAIPTGSVPAMLLPGFDEFFLGYADRSEAIDAKYVDRIVPGGNGIFQPMVVISGHIEGTWRRKIDKKGVKLTLLPFKRLPKSTVVELTLAAEEFARYHGLPLLPIEVG